MNRPVSRRGRASVDDSRPPSANYHANALARGLALLEHLAARPRPLALTDFSDATGLPKSTLVRLLSVLDEMEYVARVDDRPSYRLGHKVQVLAAAYVSTLDLSEVASGYLETLALATNQTANLGVLDGDRVVHVSVSEPHRQLRFSAPTGTRDLTYCTGLGKVLLAGCDQATVATRVPREPFDAVTKNSITTLERLRRELAKVSRQGYAVDDNERSVGLRCVAVPIVIDGGIDAAVSVSGPSGEFTKAAQQQYVRELENTAARLAADGDFRSGLQETQRSLRPGVTS